MAVIHKLGLDVLKANVEAREAHSALRTNVNKLGLVKGEDVGSKAKTRKSRKVTETPAPTVVEKPAEDEPQAQDVEDTPVDSQELKTRGEE